MHIDSDIGIVILGWLITLILAGGLWYSFQRNKVTLVNGILANVMLLSLAGSITISVYLLEWSILTGLWFVFLGLLILLVVLLSASLGILLLWNAVIVWRREQHTLANSLTLLLGAYFVLSPIFLNLLSRFSPHWVVNLISNLEVAVFGYLLFWVLSYASAFSLYWFFRPTRRRAYIIVLGAGLIDGRTVSPLLRRRIDIALKFAKRQLAKYHQMPLVILSGGQGGDEKVPEG